jgi:hypothetical protein
MPLNTSYLYDDDTLIISKPLAQALGIAESIILRRIAHWCRYNESKHTLTHFIDGKWWSYNTYEEWENDIKIYAAPSIKKALLHLEDLKLIGSHPIISTKQN